MGQINIGGVIKGGLAAGLLMNVSQFVLNVPVAGAQMNRELSALGLPAVSNQQIAVFVTITFLLGIATVWLYAAVRPRLGPGPTTAICAGLVVWALSYLHAGIVMGVLGINSMGMVLLGIVWSAIEMIVAAAVSGYLYTEQ
ncbi:MAG TPA: hypothetical protein VEA16_16835 [Vicinamibacterales bacterium]|nr:hypothetical protein [Vicinamibacterales bacterium]